MTKLFIPPVFVFVSLILIVVFYLLIPQFNWIPFPFNLGGIIISFLGFSIMGKSRDLFNKHKTTLANKKSTHLIMEGVFSKTRNPMYFGMFILLFGIGICFMNLFSILTPLGFILMINFFVIPTEEKVMLETFGQEYHDYKNRVRRWL